MRGAVLWGYLGYQCQDGDGIPELREALAAALDWDKLAKTTRPLVFQQVREAIAAHRDNGEIVLPYNELAEQIRQEHAEQFDPADVDTVVKQLAVQGVVVDTRESSGQRVLVLRIEEIERYAGALILAARENPNGVPALEEHSYRRSPVVSGHQGRATTEPHPGAQSSWNASSSYCWNTASASSTKAC